MTAVRYAATPGCLTAPVGESTMLLLPSLEYLELDEVGAAIFDRVREPASVDEVVRGLLELYDVEPDVLRADVGEYLDQLVARGAVEQFAGPAAP